MWTLGLLIRTYGGRSWDAPLTWDGLYQPTVNGHTFSAVGPATNTEDPYGGETPAGADGRAIAVYQPGEWRGVVLTNDGHAWMYATRIEIGHPRRAGEDIIEIARQVGQRAQLPSEPRSASS